MEEAADGVRALTRLSQCYQLRLARAPEDHKL